MALLVERKTNRMKKMCFTKMQGRQEMSQKKYDTQKTILDGRMNPHVS